MAKEDQRKAVSVMPGIHASLINWLNGTLEAMKPGHHTLAMALTDRHNADRIVSQRRFVKSIQEQDGAAIEVVGEEMEAPRADLKLSQLVWARFPPRWLKTRFDPSLESPDADTTMLWHHFKMNFRDGVTRCRVLEVGANEEDTARVLADAGCEVVEVDLRPSVKERSPNSVRIEGDFVKIAPLLRGEFDAVVSTSTIEHFGLPVYGGPKIEDYDSQAMGMIRFLLRDGGLCWLTVPYGGRFRVENGWRQYDRASLDKRILPGFVVEQRFYFLSGECDCPSDGVLVSEADANAWMGDLPHVTIFLKLRKA